MRYRVQVGFNLKDGTRYNKGDEVDSKDLYGNVAWMTGQGIIVPENKKESVERVVKFLEED